ncbi:hypothetical protein RclHR1_10550009 [Rhizophagus clarus]|uniref:Uncharacterized protein n=1 Tax=Rhizophagus clarus TaxID=94130 RepID=A0A2Z6QDT8_9GLOM|nr:hypothetical protein RclHR1_10550009 [Rhizophagus clarus]
MKLNICLVLLLFLLGCNCSDREILSCKKDCILVPVVSTLIEQGPNDAQKKCSRKSFTSTKKPSSKKVKKTGGKKVSPMLKKLIEELSTDVPVPTAGENLEEASEHGVSIFL